MVSFYFYILLFEYITKRSLRFRKKTRRRTRQSTSSCSSKFSSYSHACISYSRLNSTTFLILPNSHSVALSCTQEQKHRLLLTSRQRESRQASMAAQVRLYLMLLHFFFSNMLLHCNKLFALRRYQEKLVLLAGKFTFPDPSPLAPPPDATAGFSSF